MERRWILILRNGIDKIETERMETGTKRKRKVKVTGTEKYET